MKKSLRLIALIVALTIGAARAQTAATEGTWRVTSSGGAKGTLTIGEKTWALALAAPGKPLVVASGSNPFDGGALAPSVVIEKGEPVPSARAFLDALDAKLVARDPEGVRAKYERMTKDALTFLRGAPTLFYRDVKEGWHLAEHATEATRTWIAGDLHLGNFGVLELEDGTVAYEVNDFDDCARASCVLDLERLATSFVLASEDAPVESLARAYVRALHDVVEGRLERSSHVTVENAHGALARVLEKGREVPKKSRVEHLTHEKKGERRFKKDEDLVALSPDERTRVGRALAGWRVIDAARVLGKGGSSLGLDRLWVLASGPSEELRVLEWKEERASAVEVAFPGAGSGFETDAHRSVAGARALLGGQGQQGDAAAVCDSRPYLVRDLASHRGRLEHSRETQQELVETQGRVLARAHAWSDPDGKSASGVEKARAILAALGDEEAFAGKLASYARAYARKVQIDREVFIAEVARDGK